MGGGQDAVSEGTLQAVSKFKSSLQVRVGPLEFWPNEQPGSSALQKAASPPDRTGIV